MGLPAPLLPQNTYLDNDFISVLELSHPFYCTVKGLFLASPFILGLILGVWLHQTEGKVIVH